jgi:hypothetical protein
LEWRESRHWRDILIDIEFLKSMAHTPIRNYIVPGLTSWLIGARGPNGLVRLFHSERQQVESITPHSHRFDFHCLVLSGSVKNRIWTETTNKNPDYPIGDRFAVSALAFNEIGDYKSERCRCSWWDFEDVNYRNGDTYSMKAEEIHSIIFGRDTWVLFFEGPEKSKNSLILEPFVDGERIPTFKTEEWMFKKPSASEVLA